MSSLGKHIISDAILLGAVHRCDANFHITCGINGCVRTYQNYYSFRKHLNRAHHGDASASVDNTDSVVDHVLIDEPEVDVVRKEPDVDSIRTSALFLIKAQEIHKVSQIALDNIIAELTFMCSKELSLLQTKVFKYLSNGGVDPDKIDGLKEVFNKCGLNNPFHGLTSHNLRSLYTEEHLGFVVCYYACSYKSISKA